MPLAIAVVGDAAGDANFAGGGDRVHYSVGLEGAQGPFQVEAELWFEKLLWLRLPVCADRSGACHRTERDQRIRRRDNRRNRPRHGYPDRGVRRRQYEPVTVVANVGEAREIAQDDFRSRMERLERGESPLCPFAYKVWARGINGEHRIACEISY